MASSDIHMLTPAQLRVLSNPVREEILGLLCCETLSAARLATRLSDPPGNLHYHLERLRRAGLVELVEERPVRGATEKFFRAVASNFSVAPEVLGGLGGSAVEHELLPVLRRHADVVLRELGPALERGGGAGPVTSYQRLRLSPAAAERLRQRIMEWLEDCRAADGVGAEEAEEAEEAGAGAGASELEEWLLFSTFFRRVPPG